MKLTLAVIFLVLCIKYEVALSKAIENNFNARSIEIKPNAVRGRQSYPSDDDDYYDEEEDEEEEDELQQSLNEENYDGNPGGQGEEGAGQAEEEDDNEDDEGDAEEDDEERFMENKVFLKNVFDIL